MIDIAVFIYFILCALFVQYVIEVKAFVRDSIVDLNFFLVFTDADAVVDISIFDLAIEEGSDPNGCFYFTTHNGGYNNFIRGQL